LTGICIVLDGSDWLEAPSLASAVHRKTNQFKHGITNVLRFEEVFLKTLDAEDIHDG